jgi:plastocyanin
MRPLASQRRARITRALLVSTLTLATIVAALALPAAAASGSLDAAVAAERDASRGMVYDGLKASRADGPCRGRGFEIADGSATACTHGPDAAPAGVDVRARRSTTSVTAAASQASVVAAASGSASVSCIGDGVSGNRVQAIYAHASNVAGRYASVVASIRSFAASIDADFRDSAAKTGGTRVVRWVTDSSCQLSVLNVTLSATGDDDIYKTRDELKAQGFGRADRKYAVWMDANVYCGIGFVESDDSAASTNRNNGNASVPGLVSRTDAQCWGMAEAHELMHNLGGVQLSAPHTSNLWHCTDEYDRMCYPDGTTRALTYTCPDADNRLFDCHNDDYFNTKPTAGSYLATHWNTANSSFLDGGGTAPPPPPPPSTYSLNLTRSGSGTVTSIPAGINCGSDCSESYSSGSLVTLTSVPSLGGLFSGWAGACSGTSLTCVVTMAAAKSVTATFGTGTTPPPPGPVAVSNAGFGPQTLLVSQGTPVTWRFDAASHAVRDALARFDSGTRAAGTTFGFTFSAAGTFDYTDPAGGLPAGVVRVPIQASPASGSRTATYTVTWSAVAAPSPWVYDVVVKRPGGMWQTWRTGVATNVGSFVPDAGAGRYTFSSRLRNTTTGLASRYSPIAAITAT